MTSGPLDALFVAPSVRPWSPHRRAQALASPARGKMAELQVRPANSRRLPSCECLLRGASRPLSVRVLRCAGSARPGRRGAEDAACQPGADQAQDRHRRCEAGTANRDHRSPRPKKHFGRLQRGSNCKTSWLAAAAAAAARQLRRRRPARRRRRLPVKRGRRGTPSGPSTVPMACGTRPWWIR